jgi:hypothetical protein
MVLDVIADPFVGIICFSCNDNGYVLPTSCGIRIKLALKHHISKVHQEVLSSSTYENDLDIASVKLRGQLKNLALRYEGSVGAQRAKEILMSTSFHPMEWVSVCTSCQFVKRENDNRVRQRHKRGCTLKSFDGKLEVQYHRVKLDLYIEKGECSRLKFHRYYDSHCRKATVGCVTAAPSEDAGIEGEDNRHTMLARNLRTVAPTKKFNTNNFHQSIVDGFTGGLRVGQETVPHHQNFYHQIEHHLMKGSCQPVLAQFVCEHYEALVVGYFEGDWSKYADFFHKQLHGEKLHWEEKLHQCVKVMFGEQYSVLRQVSPQFRTEIQTVGLYRPKSHMYSVVEKCRSYLRGMLAEETNEDDGCQPMHGDPMQMLVEDIVSIVDESESASTGIPKLLSPAGCEKTRDGYCCTMADYVVFLVRMYSNGFCGSDDLCKSVHAFTEKLFTEDIAVSEMEQRNRIQGFAMQLLIGSLHLEQLQSYSSMMETDVTMAELYCLGMAVKRQDCGESDIFFNFKGPSTVHATASRLFYSLRIAACGACVHAARVGDLGLQKLLVGPKVFTNSSTWIAIARLQKSTKGYESKLEEGLEPAKYSISSANIAIPDVFTITHPSRQTVVKITRTMFGNCVRECHKDITEMTRGIIRLLCQKKIKCFFLKEKELGELDLNDPGVYQAFEVSVLSRLPQLRDPGSYKVIDVPLYNLGKLNGSIFSSTLSCLYTVTLDNGSEVEVESMEIARLLSEVLGKETNLRLLVDAT